MFRQRGGGAAFEDPADRHLPSGDRADTADESGRQQGMATQREEVVIHTYSRDVEHLGEQAAQHTLGLGAGLAPGGQQTEVGPG